jgi:hypothetical protein
MHGKLLSQMAFSALALCWSANAMADTIFNLNATLTSGAILSGTVTINTTTGAATAANITATVPTTENFTLSNPIFNTDNFEGTNLEVITALNNNNYPQALLGFQVSSLVGFTGGAITSGSGVFTDSATRHAVTSGALTFFASTSVAGDNSSIFNVSGTLEGGGTLGGQVTVDLVTGKVLSGDVTAAIPVVNTYTLSTAVSATPNFEGTGLEVIQVLDNNNYPDALLGFQVSSLVGFPGGNITTGSGLFTDANTRYGLVSGTLTPVATPTPSTLGLVCVGLGGFFIRRRSSTSVG